MANLKNITDLPVAESAEGLNLIVHENGEAKQIPASLVGAQSDFAVTDESNPAFIKNKPTIAQPDWNARENDSGYILNKPFYDETVQNVILPKTQYAHGDRFNMFGLGINDGDTLIVKYDDIEYLCKVIVDLCLEDVAYTPKVTFIGNPNIGFSYSSYLFKGYSEPFFLSNYDIRFKDQQSHTIEIYKNSGVLQKIDKKYIPPMAVAYRYYNYAFYDANGNIVGMNKEKLINDFMSGVVRFKTYPDDYWGTMIGYRNYNGNFYITYHDPSSNSIHNIGVF